MRDAALIIHFLGMAMGLGTSFAFLFLGIASSKMEKSEGSKFLINALYLSKMGNLGLGLLLISGLYLLMPYHTAMMEMPLFMVKFFLFIVLGGLLGIIGSKAKKARKEDAEKHLEAIRKIGQITLLIGLTIVILAVLQFH